MFVLIKRKNICFELFLSFLNRTEEDENDQEERK